MYIFTQLNVYLKFCMHVKEKDEEKLLAQNKDEEKK